MCVGGGRNWVRCRLRVTRLEQSFSVMGEGVETLGCQKVAVGGRILGMSSRAHLKRFRRGRHDRGWLL